VRGVIIILSGKLFLLFAAVRRQAALLAIGVSRSLKHFAFSLLLKGMFLKGPQFF